jgi:hypothetical protein
MSTQSSPFGPPPHPYAQASRQLGMVATILVWFASALGLIAISGVLALALRPG